MQTMPLSAPQWPRRHVLHKQGTIGVMLAMLLFLVGFSVPAWASHSGLWMKCWSAICVSNISSESEAWMNAVRVMECVAMLAFFLCALMAVVQDWFLDITPSSYSLAVFVEVLAFTAGVTGITGAAIFGMNWRSIDSPSHQQLNSSNSSAHPQESNVSDLQWGFALVITASVVTLLSAAALVYCRCRLAQTASTMKMGTSAGRRGKAFLDEDVSYRDCQEAADTSSMMLVPAGHFDNKSTPNTRGVDPPPYALPPPYPYASNFEFFLPIANSSMVPQIAGTSLNDGSRQADDSRSPPLPVSNDTGLVTPAQSFTSPVSPYFVTDNRPALRPLFVKTDGGSEIEITPSAQNSSGLPSPYNQF